MKNPDPHVTTSNIIPKGEPVIHQRPTTRRGKLLFSLKPFVGGEPRPGNLHKQSCPCKPYISCPAHAETMIKSNPQNRNELHPPLKGDCEFVVIFPPDPLPPMWIPFFSISKDPSVATHRSCELSACVSQHHRPCCS